MISVIKKTSDSIINYLINAGGILLFAVTIRLEQLHQILLRLIFYY